MVEWIGGKPPNPPYSVLAFDYGTRKIGTAIGQSLLRSASPGPLLSARDGQPDWNALAALLAEWEPELLLVGLPLNMDTSESALSQQSRKFAQRLHGRFGKPTVMLDERLTTREARDRAEQQAVDSVAAAILIENWFALKNA